jgi:hypothetical protein
LQYGHTWHFRVFAHKREPFLRALRHIEFTPEEIAYANACEAGDAAVCAHDAACIGWAITNPNGKSSFDAFHEAYAKEYARTMRGESERQSWLS